MGDEVIVNDPELMSFCRLCLENKGMFLVMPILSEQAKYCYGIKIEPLDGLPQLLCLDCKNKLSVYYTDKKTYVDKQDRLLEKNGKKKVPLKFEQEADSSCQLDPRPVLNDQIPKNEKPRPALNDQIPKYENPMPVVNVHISNDEKPRLEVNVKIQKDDTPRAVLTPQILNAENQLPISDIQIPNDENQLPISDIQILNDENTQPVSNVSIIIDENMVPQTPDDNMKEHDKNKNSSKNFRITTEPGCLQIKIQGSDTDNCKSHVGEASPQENVVGDSAVTKITTDQSRKSSTDKSVSSTHNHPVAKSPLSRSDLEYSYTCKICNRSYKWPSNVKKHVKRVHENILKSLHTLCPKPCKVKLQRLANGATDRDGIFEGVAVEKSRIVTGIENAYYSKWIVLKNQNNDEDQSSSDADFSPQSNQSSFLISDSSDSEVAPRHNLKRSRRRLSSESDSESSADLNVLPKKKKVPHSSNETKTPTAEASSARKEFLCLPDNVFLKKLVFNTFNRYSKSTNETESVHAKPNDILNRKLLNVGTKTMLKQGIQSVGLLKYLEKRHLEIIWCNIKKPEYSTISGQVRINTKLMNGSESPNSFDGFQVLQNKTQHELKAKSAKISLKKPDEPIQLFESTSTNITKTLLNATPVPNPKLGTFKPRTYTGPVQSVEDTIDLPTNNNSVLKEVDSVTITPIIPPIIEEKTICLDSDDESSDCVMPVITSTTSLAEDTKIFNVKNEKLNTSKEIITAEEKDNVTAAENTKQASNEPLQFRIKCKPVSELLASINTLASPSTCKQNIVLNNAISGPPPPYLSASVSVIKSPAEVAIPTIQQDALNQFMPVQPAILKNQNSQYGYVAISPSMMAGPAPFSALLKTSASSNQIATSSSSNSPNMQNLKQATSRPTDDPIDRSKCANKQNDFIQLTSVAFPSTLTASPIRYLAKLLHLHKIKLELAAEPVPASFYALIRFKLSVQQKPIQKTLSVQLYVGANVAYIRVATSDNKVVKLENMLGSWQWEVLKSFQETHVVAKVIAASNNIGGQVADTAKTFVNLLGTIKQVKKSETV